MSETIDGIEVDMFGGAPVFALNEDFEAHSGVELVSKIVAALQADPATAGSVHRDFKQFR